jgi:hypothetical protein
MAEKLGVGQSRISVVEAGAEVCSREMGMTVLHRFRPELARLELSLEDLFTGTEIPPAP